MPKPSKIRITAPDAIARGGTFELNGVDISELIDGLTVEFSVDDVTRTHISYVCTAVEFDGETHVTHRCPLGGQE